MLQLAESRFGQRDRSYTPLGIEFCGDIPKLWYPHNCGNVIIQLTESCITNLIQACYQLAHECVHLLSPSGGQHANVLEEGLATTFAHGYLQDSFNFDMPESIKSYQDARTLTDRLLALDSSIIRKIRNHQSAIYQISAKDILAACPICPSDLAADLAKPFVR